MTGEVEGKRGALALKVLRSPDLKVAAYFAVWLACLLGFCYFIMLLNPNQPNLPSQRSRRQSRSSRPLRLRLDCLHLTHCKRVNSLTASLAGLTSTLASCSG